MKKPIVDHIWTKIADRDYIGKVAAQQKLDEVQRLSNDISQSEGIDIDKSALGLGFIEIALLRCRQCHENDNDSRFTNDDLHINYSYATEAMYKAEEIIGNKLDHL
ncbi:hypothetical protein QNM99_24965 [Pseudomonas sp. PCH446]